MALTSRQGPGPSAGCEVLGWTLRGLLPLALVAGAGCGDEDRAPPLGAGRPVPGCEEFSYQTCDILDAACEREVFGLMACLYGEADPGSPPPVRRLDEASAIALLSESSEGMAMTEGLDAMDAASDARDFQAGVRGLELLGMLSPGLIEDESDVLEVTLSSVVAYYLDTTKEVVIIDRGDPVKDLEANSVLGHEFVHALQDRRHDLGNFDATDEVVSSDRGLAVSSLIEGEASLYQYLLIYAYQGSNLQNVNFNGFFARLVGLGDDATLEAGSPALTANGIFPYTYGARFAGERWLAGGSSALDAVYQDPPHTSLEVLERRDIDASELAVFDQPPAALDGYEEMVDDSVGAWVSVATAAGAGAAQLSLAELASHWRGDRYWIYASVGEDASVAALWAIDWDTPAAAAQFESLAAALAPEGGLLHIDTSGVSTRVTVVERAEDIDAWRARLAQAVPPRLEP
jgi:hypothetical protein